MSETKSASVALALAVFSLAVVGAWVLAGASVPSPAAPPAVASPLTAMLLLVTREGLPTIGAAIVWLLAFDVALAGVVAALLVVRARRSPGASRLALAIALLAAGFATAFFLQSLSPFDAWAAALNERASRAFAFGGMALGVAVASGASVAMVTLGLWTLFRFWLSYPASVDPEAVAEFARARWYGVFRRTTLGARLRRDPGHAVPPPIVQRSITRWFQPSSVDRPMNSPLGRWLLGWTIGAALAWWAGALASSALEGASGKKALLGPIVAMMGIFPIFLLISLSVDRIADAVSYQYDLAGERDHRRIEWLHAAGVFSRFAANNGFLLIMAAMLVWMPIEAHVLERPEPMFDKAPFVVAILFPLVLLPAVYIAGLGASMLARGLIDPRLALRKITLWTVLGVLVTLIFVAIERVVALQLVRWLALPADSGAIVAGAAIAMTFVPLRRAVQGWVNGYVERRMPVHVLADGERHTGAVAVVDISAFTALTARDESAALLATTLLQREAKRIADAHDGRVVKSTGDGVMLAFAHAADAVAAVRTLYGEFARMRESLSLPPIALHAGLNWGEYVDVRGADIYGHTVNLASRLADAAGPGEIVASAEYAAALGAVEPPPLPLGTKRFKNVAEPVACVRM